MNPVEEVKEELTKPIDDINPIKDIKDTVEESLDSIPDPSQEIKENLDDIVGPVKEIKLEELIKLDRELFIYLNNLGTQLGMDFGLFIGKNLLDPNVHRIIGRYLQKFGLRRTCLILGLCLFMVLLTDQITNLFKDNFERLRPCHDSEFEEL